MTQLRDSGAAWDVTRQAGWMAPNPECLTHSYGASVQCIEKTDFCPLSSAQWLEKRSPLTNLTLGTSMYHRGDILVTPICGFWVFWPGE